ncbi:MAG: hypothetical protein ACYSUS_03215 [Planctomycetota bacterium]
MVRASAIGARIASGTRIAYSDRSDGRGAMDDAGVDRVGTSETVIARARRLPLSQTAGRSGTSVEGAWEGA